MFGVLNVSTSGLVAQRTRLEVASANLANAYSIYDANSSYAPYRRRMAMLAQGDAAGDTDQGVHVHTIEKDNAPLRAVLNETHPLADKNGYIYYPNIEPTLEYVDAMEASRAYEANLTMAEATNK